MSFSLNDVSIAARVGAGLLVTAGAAGMSFVAVAMASGGADLSDETGTAVGPATIYAFLFVGGLFNVLLVEDTATRVAGLALYAFAGWTYWQAGVEQAGFCLDAEAVRARRVRAADAATMLIVYALGGSALLSGGKSMGVRGLRARAGLPLPLTLLIGVGAAIYLARRPRAVARSGCRARCCSRRALGAAAPAASCLARAVARTPRCWRSPWRSRAGAGRGDRPARHLAAFGLDVADRGRGDQHGGGRDHRAAVAVPVGAGGPPRWGRSSLVATGHAAAAVAYAFTGRVAAAWLARVVLVGLAAFASFT